MSRHTRVVALEVSGDPAAAVEVGGRRQVGPVDAYGYRPGHGFDPQVLDVGQFGPRPGQRNGGGHSGPVLLGADRVQWRRVAEHFQELLGLRVERHPWKSNLRPAHGGVEILVAPGVQRRSRDTRTRAVYRGRYGLRLPVMSRPGDLGEAEIRGVPSASTTSAEPLLPETERPLAAQRRLRYRGGPSG
jgi:hypothetical protein